MCQTNNINFLLKQTRKLTQQLMYNIIFIQTFKTSNYLESAGNIIINLHLSYLQKQ